jgi:AcrR family transcriptional regulator
VPPQPRLSRDAILAAARALVVQHGRSALSLRPLAARLDVTAPALYAHFESKESLLVALAEEEFSRLIVEIESSGGGADPLDRVRAQSHAYVRYAVANPALFEIIFEFRPAWGPAPAAARELPLASKAFEISAVAVTEAIRAGELREQDPLMASLTIWAAVHGIATVVAAMPQLGDDYEAALVDSVIDSVLAGLAVPRPKSRKRGR